MDHLKADSRKVGYITR